MSSWIIKKHKINILPTPKKTIKNGLKVEYEASEYWKKKHPHELPEMATDIVAGQTDYPLPKYFRGSSILKVVIN